MVVSPSLSVKQVVLQNPVFYGSYFDGKLSFGELDQILFAESDSPFELPDLELVIRNGRGLIETEFGDIGFSIDSSGHLRGGFSGTIAASAPTIDSEICKAREATMFGTVTIDAERPRIRGPIRIEELSCVGQAQLTGFVAELNVGADRQLLAFDSEFSIEKGAVALATASIAKLAGTGKTRWNDGTFVAEYELEGDTLAAPEFALSEVALDGDFRAENVFEKMEARARINGRDLAIGSGLDQQLASVIQATDGTLIAPLLSKLRSGLLSQLPGSMMTADVIWRQDDKLTKLIFPEGPT